MDFYDITKGQLITMWIFGVLLWMVAIIGSMQIDPSTLAILGIFIVPFFLIFYTIGWKANKEED